MTLVVTQHKPVQYFNAFFQTTRSWLGSVIVKSVRLQVVTTWMIHCGRVTISVYNQHPGRLSIPFLRVTSGVGIFRVPGTSQWYVHLSGGR